MSDKHVLEELAGGQVLVLGPDGRYAPVIGMTMREALDAIRLGQKITVDVAGGKTATPALPAIPAGDGLPHSARSGPDRDAVTFREVVGEDGVVRKYVGGFNPETVLRAIGIELQKGE
ncbi:hypothetical protein [Zavarzinella formosa]|uniref:hypothetical protein n=1 Tax=Zavarzinella formosa TaxID=360055 RepID=UPI0002F0C5A6|nr:hypothetical protein [Zavarzinella formosa]